MVGLMVGIALGLVSVWLVRRLRGEPWMFAFALLLLPIIYVWFALVDGSGANASRELLAGLPWLLAGVALLWFKIPQATLIVGAFWLLHAVYDVVHDERFVNPGVPDWYPLACLGTDVVIGGYLAYVGLREKRPATV